MDAYEKVEIARNPKRKTSLDYIEKIFDEFIELHGDRQFKDDKAIICGLAKIDNTPFTIIAEQKGRTTKENIDCSTGGNCSSVFRVEKVDGDCATFRVLMANPDVSASYPYVATNSFFTMNLKCVCCLKCLNDTYVDAV